MLVSGSFKDGVRKSKGLFWMKLKETLGMSGNEKQITYDDTGLAPVRISMTTEAVCKGRALGLQSGLYRPRSLERWEMLETT